MKISKYMKAKKAIYPGSQWLGSSLAMLRAWVRYDLLW